MNCKSQLKCPLEERIQERRGDYGYRIKNLGGGADRYGPCEVCKCSVETTFYQVECMKTDLGWTYHNCHSLFGHEVCLIGLRKKDIKQ